MPPVSYHTGRFPPSQLDWIRLVPLIGSANAAVARYDGALASVPNSHILTTPLITREAVLSSKIEGTQASMGEVLRFEAGQPPKSQEQRDDINEILNYRAALNGSVNLLKELPLCQRAIKAIHKILLSGVRGQDKAPGEYRKGPVWIGNPGSSIEEARFIPPGADILPRAVSDWEKYLNKDEPDGLVQLAIVHAEFEALHPFFDGNGRIGRILVPLFLWQRKIIREPRFYISAYFEKHREDYYEGLLAVSRDDNWTGWCLFFLGAIKSQAEDNLAKAEKMIDLYNSLKVKIDRLTGARHTVQTLDWIFRTPIFASSHFFRTSGIPSGSGRSIVQILVREKILTEIVGATGSRPAIISFDEVLQIAG